MHEYSLIANLFKKVDGLVKEQNADRATEVTVRLGALSHISPEHFREHFEQAAPGTVAEGAQLNVLTSTDASDPNAQEILLESIEIE